MGEYGMETSTIAQQEKVEKPTIHRKTDDYSFFLDSWPSPGT
jgi:hypothetical protein